MSTSRLEALKKARAEPFFKKLGEMRDERRRQRSDLENHERVAANLLLECMAQAIEHGFEGEVWDLPRWLKEKLDQEDK